MSISIYNDRIKYYLYGPIERRPYTSRREAYLPKETYPFNSVNFRNLAPMCHQCNSSNKFRQDPLFRQPGKHGCQAPARMRRKAFYPYTRDKIDINIEVVLLSNDISNLRHDQIDLKISSVDHPEEVQTWTEVFNIEERYKDIMRKNFLRAPFLKACEKKGLFNIPN